MCELLQNVESKNGLEALVLGLEQVFHGVFCNLANVIIRSKNSGNSLLSRVLERPAALTAATRVLNCPQSSRADMMSLA